MAQSAENGTDILEILFTGTLNPEDGEQASNATGYDITQLISRYGSSSFAHYNNSTTTPLGNKIDILIKSNQQQLELSCNEWKNSNSTDAINHQQQSKNIRSNTSLQRMIHRTTGLNCSVLGMDWVGYVGYIFSVDAVDDLYIVQSISDLLHPTVVVTMTDVFYNPSRSV